MTLGRNGEHWYWYEPPGDDMPLPEWLLDMRIEWHNEIGAWPAFVVKAAHGLKTWPGQEFVKSGDYYRSWHPDGRMVQHQSGDPRLRFDETLDAWRSGDRLPNVSRFPTEKALGPHVRLKMHQPQRMSFLGGVVSLFDGAWSIEGEHPGDFNGDYRGKDVIIFSPAGGVPPLGYSFVWHLDMSAIADVQRALKEDLGRPREWFAFEKTAGLCVRHDMLARAAAKYLPGMRIAVVVSSNISRLEPLRENAKAPHKMYESERIEPTKAPVTERESLPETEPAPWA